jgi:hypothetical protein
LTVVSGNLLRLAHQDRRQSFVPLAQELRALREEGYRVAGYRLGLREESAVGYYLEDRVLNLEEEGEAARLLDPAGPPAALVGRRSALEETPTLFETAAGRASFEVSRGMEVLTNRSPQARP